MPGIQSVHGQREPIVLQVTALVHCGTRPSTCRDRDTGAQCVHGYDIWAHLGTRLQSGGLTAPPSAGWRRPGCSG
jgi:hypothetical protein